MTYISTPTFVQHYARIYDECLDAGFTSDEADHYANVHAFNAVNEELQYKRKAIQIDRASTVVARKPVVMRVVADLAEVNKTAADLTSKKATKSDDKMELQSWLADHGYGYSD